MLGKFRSGQRRRRPGTRGPSGPAYAAIDLGTNNCRLLVAKPTISADGAPGFRVVDAFSRIVRLGEGLSASGELSEEAIGRTVAALGICARKIRRNGVVAARAVATAACRQARNYRPFLERVRRETGLELEIITAREEAQLAFEGCVSLLDPAAKSALVFDIGGGSTELIWLGTPCGRGTDTPKVLETISLPRGVVNLSECFGGRDLAPETYAAMVREVDGLLAPFDARHGIAERVARGEVQMLGTSGTVTTLAAMHLDLPRYDRARVDGCYLSFDELAAVTRRLSAMSYAERVASSCIGTRRADLVLAGSAILDAICRMWPVGRLRVADRGLREGILMGMMSAPAAGN